MSGVPGNPAYPPKPVDLMPPHSLNKSGEVLARGFDRLGWHWWPGERAVVTAPHDGRQPCPRNCESCHQGCPREAKNSSDVVHWPEALRNGVVLKTRARVREITVDGDGLASGALYLRRRRPPHRAAGTPGGRGLQRNRDAEAAPQFSIPVLSARPGQRQRHGREGVDGPSQGHGGGPVRLRGAGDPGARQHLSDRATSSPTARTAVDSHAASGSCPAPTGGPSRRRSVRSRSPLRRPAPPSWPPVALRDGRCRGVPPTTRHCGSGSSRPWP